MLKFYFNILIICFLFTSCGGGTSGSSSTDNIAVKTFKVDFIDTTDNGNQNFIMNVLDENQQVTTSTNIKGNTKILMQANSNDDLVDLLLESETVDAKGIFISTIDGNSTISGEITFDGSSELKLTNLLEAKITSAVCNNNVSNSNIENQFCSFELITDKNINNKMSGIYFECNELVEQDAVKIEENTPNKLIFKIKKDKINSCKNSRIILKNGKKSIELELPGLIN